MKHDTMYVKAILILIFTASYFLRSKHIHFFSQNLWFKISKNRRRKTPNIHVNFD